MGKISIKNVAEAIDKETANRTGAELAKTINNIVNFLKNKKLLSQSEQILNFLESEINKKEGKIKMKVRSAQKIGEQKRKELEHEIKEKYKVHHVDSSYFEDRSLLGGMKIEVGEDVLDATYRNKLNQLEKYLINK